MTTSTSILDVIQHYQRSIERCQSDEGRLLHCISKLYKLPVKVEHLHETGIGKTVNSLRKFDGEIGVASKALVTKWKAMVTAEEIETHCQSTNEPIAEHETGSSHSVQDAVVDSANPNHDEVVEVETSIQTHKTSPDKKERHHRSRDRSETKDKEKERRHHSDRDKDRRHNDKSSTDTGVEDRRKVERSKERQSQNGIEEKSSPTRGTNGRSTSRGAEDEADALAPKQHTSKDREKEKSHHEREKENKHKDNEKQGSSGSRERHKEGKSDKHGKHKSSKEKDQHRHKSSSSRHSSAAKAAVTDSPPDEGSRKRILDDSVASTSKRAKKEKEAKIKSSDDDERNVEDDGIDSSMGANFADVLGMLNVPTKKAKKAISTGKSPTAASGPHTSKDVTPMKRTTTSGTKSGLNGTKSATPSSAMSRPPDAKPDLLSSSAKLEPLDPSIALELPTPTIPNNYKPLPMNQTVMDCVYNTSNSSSSRTPSVRALTDAEALSHSIQSKQMRTKIYSGVKTGQIHQVPSLFDLCIRVLQKNIDALEYTGGVPFEVLRPVLERATPQQLFVFEEYNPYLMEDSDALWKLHVQRNYRSQKREEMESWREMFLRCQEDQERKLSILAQNIKQSQKIIAAPVRKTQLAFVDSLVKPPRGVQRKQEQYGTKSKLIATPAARVAALSSVTPNAAKAGDTRLRVAASVRDAAQVSHASVRPKKAPLMAKTLQFMRGRHKR